MEEKEITLFMILIDKMSSYVESKMKKLDYVANNELHECMGMLSCMRCLGIITTEEYKQAYKTMLYYK